MSQNVLAEDPVPLLTARVAGVLVLGWGTVAAMALVNRSLNNPVAPLLLTALLAVIVTVIITCAFGVVKQAEILAQRLGEPYGSLVLTLSIVTIEVILISAVMLGPGDHTTIARDSVMAVSMIIMNLVIGVSLLVGGVKHSSLQHNRTGTSIYLSMLTVLLLLAFGLPSLLTSNASGHVVGTYTKGQEIPIVIITVLAYGFFLYRQMGPQAADFHEFSSPESAPAITTPIGQVLAEHRGDIIGHLVLLVITALPVVLLSHYMATYLDDGLGRLGAPEALAGLLIAMIVFLPESLTSVRAALAGQIQRVSNLCHGALVSTVGLTIPAVLVIGLITDQSVLLAETPANLALLVATMIISVATFSAPAVTAAHGLAHIILFIAYTVVLFS